MKKGSKQKKKSKLNHRQYKFIQEYLIGRNATQAAILAGYSKRTAQEQSSRLLSNVMIATAISDAQKKCEIRTEITQDRILRELACFAFLDPKDLYEDDGSLKLIKDMPESARRAIAGLEVTEIFDNAKDDQKQAIGLLKKIRLIPKQQGLDLLMQHLGMLGKPGNERETDNERVIAALEKIANEMMR